MARHIIADLHLHSTHSDGELTPVEIVNQAARIGLKFIAITDHDAISGIAPAMEAAKGTGITVIPGCELSAYEEDTELHILGLYVDHAADSALGKLLAEVRAERPARLLKMAEKLRSLGVRVKDQDITDEVGTSESPGRAHVAAVLVKMGAVATMGEAFAKYLGLKGPAYVTKQKYPPTQIIDAIHNAGGVAILAHPGQYKQITLTTLMKKYPLDGIEIFHHSHAAADRDIYLRMAQSHDWLFTGGSDYHGPRRKPGIEVGLNGVTVEELEKLRSRIPSRA